MWWSLNTLRPRQNVWHFTVDIFQFTFLNEDIWILINISLKFVSKGQINNIPALVQIMVWCWPRDKPLSEPMVVSFLMHICITQPQWGLTGHIVPLWHYNGHDGISNHQPHDCLPNRLFRRRWKKTSKLRVTGLCVGKSPGTVNSPHKWPVTRKMFPFDDFIME